jgi:hypothetical protein
VCQDVLVVYYYWKILCFDGQKHCVEAVVDRFLFTILDCMCSGVHIKASFLCVHVRVWYIYIYNFSHLAARVCLGWAVAKVYTNWLCRYLDLKNEINTCVWLCSFEMCYCECSQYHIQEDHNNRYCSENLKSQILL